MSKMAKHLTIQALLVAVWVLILVSAYRPVPVLSQIQQGCSEPPFWNDSPPTNSWANYAWPLTTSIEVRIDREWNSPESQAIETGVQKWNVSANCSNVRFEKFSAITIQDYEEAPPNNTVYWQRTDPHNQGYNGAVRNHLYPDSRVRASRIQIMPTVTNQTVPDYFVYLGTHETGHTFNLGHPGSFGTSIMGGHSNSDRAFNNHGPFECDFFKLNQQYPCGTPTPTPTPSPSPTPANQDECESISWFWNPFSNTCQQDPPPSCVLLPEVCENGIWSFEWCGCVPYNTPIVIDVAGDGFDLTSSAAGVHFNLNNIGGNEKLAWTNAGSDDTWLVLDRNGNGQIDDGTELFGDVTPQPQPRVGEKKNGFLALAVFDAPANGGNGDRLITQADTIFGSLRLWRDVDHNGVSATSELSSLHMVQIEVLELEYKISKHVDQSGNEFRYRAKIKDANHVGRWMWDVILVKKL